MKIKFNFLDIIKLLFFIFVGILIIASFVNVFHTSKEHKVKHVYTIELIEKTGSGDNKRMYFITDDENQYHWDCHPTDSWWAESKIGDQYPRSLSYFDFKESIWTYLLLCGSWILVVCTIGAGVILFIWLLTKIIPKIIEFFKSKEFEIDTDNLKNYIKVKTYARRYRKNQKLFEKESKNSYQS